MDVKNNSFIYVVENARANQLNNVLIESEEDDQDIDKVEEVLFDDNELSTVVSETIAEKQKYIEQLKCIFQSQNVFIEDKDTYIGIITEHSVLKDHGDHVWIETDDKRVAADEVIKIALAKKWDEINVHGDDGFIDLVRDIATEHNITVNKNDNIKKNATDKFNEHADRKNTEFNEISEGSTHLSDESTNESIAFMDIEDDSALEIIDQLSTYSEVPESAKEIDSHEDDLIFEELEAAHRPASDCRDNTGNISVFLTELTSLISMHDNDLLNHTKTVKESRKQIEELENKLRTDKLSSEEVTNIESDIWSNKKTISDSTKLISLLNDDLNFYKDIADKLSILEDGQLVIPNYSELGRSIVDQVYDHNKHIFTTLNKIEMLEEKLVRSFDIALGTRPPEGPLENSYHKYLGNLSNQSKIDWNKLDYSLVQNLAGDNVNQSIIHEIIATMSPVLLRKEIDALTQYISDYVSGKGPTYPLNLSSEYVEDLISHVEVSNKVILNQDSDQVYQSSDDLDQVSSNTNIPMV